MNLLGVEPKIPVIGGLGGQLVILPIVPAYQHPESAAGAKFPGLGRAVDPLFSLGPQKARIPQLSPDIREVLFRFRLGNLLQHTLQILQIPPGNGHLLFEIPLRCFGLAVALIVLGGVLLGGEQWVQ